ncbi:E3 ubiquitin-protein ligase MIB2 [Gossypium arboreum]|uniref:E3 ubiquitin-protein ligase MIB2 n=1 Tax=Gossypium arboreum TaxID=29729 RepID=A0A0B0MCN5_GOSAR|nr:E3 ubiquitin-protein ligase MIB2 [Gossypium arboreum]
MACNPACASAANRDDISEWMTIFDAKIPPPTSRTIINQSPQQKSRHCSLIPQLKTQYLPHSDDTEGNERLQPLSYA